MTKEEFDKLMGHAMPCADEKFQKARAIYDASNLSKEAFCEDYRAHSDSLVIERLMKAVVSLRKDNEELKTKSDKLFHVQQMLDTRYREIRDLVDKHCRLIESLVDNGNIDQDEAAEYLEDIEEYMDTKAFIRFKLDNNITLTEEDRGYILDNWK